MNLKPEMDPLRNAFRELQAHSSGRAEHFFELEEHLMEIQNRSNKRPYGKVLVASAVGLLLTAAGAEAATGVLSASIRSVTVSTECGSFETTEYTAVQEADGSITVSVPIPDGEDGATVTVDATN